jgi:hypothetical protein
VQPDGQTLQLNPYRFRHIIFFRLISASPSSSFLFASLFARFLPSVCCPDFRCSWNQAANIIYLESPSGVGFSYGTNNNYTSGDKETAAGNLQVPLFLVVFFRHHLLLHSLTVCLSISVCLSLRLWFFVSSLCWVGSKSSPNT